MSDNETLADIMAEMRGQASRASHFNGDEIRAFADRIEAATKRERAALVAEAETAKDARNRCAVRLGVKYAERCRECKAKSGNAAAMREAIVIIRDMLINGGHDAQCRAKIVTICNTVLSSPPRNCDKYATAEKARLAFWDTHETIWEAFKNRSGMALFYEVLNWIFATEEGGAE